MPFVGMAVQARPLQETKTSPLRRVRVWVGALAFAVSLHSALVLLGAWVERPLWARSGLQVAPLLTIEVVSEEEPDDGGGSAVPGKAEDTSGAAEKPPEPAPQAARPPPVEEEPEPQRAEEPVQPEAVEQDGAEAAFDPDADWFEQDLMLTQTADDEAPRVRARAAFEAVAHSRTFAQPMAGDSEAKDGRHAGSGPGRNGGDGGWGSPVKQPRFVEEDFAFGGTEGAFLGRMCFVPNTLRSLRALGACTTVLQFRTDLINVPPRQFDLGFPGIPDRDEWFSILYTGTITVSTSGEYAFRVLSDDGSVLHIDGKTVVDNDGLHGPQSVQSRVELAEGPHRLELWYFQGPRMLVALQVFVTPPGQGERLLGPTL